MEMWDKLRVASQQYLEGTITEAELQHRTLVIITTEQWCAGDRVIVTELAGKIMGYT